eukprot:scaffold310260_cov13-Tisochrysis_lutea.AAC.1
MYVDPSTLAVKAPAPRLLNVAEKIRIVNEEEASINAVGNAFDLYSPAQDLGIRSLNVPHPSHRATIKKWVKKGMILIMTGRPSLTWRVVGGLIGEAWYHQREGLDCK